MFPRDTCFNVSLLVYAVLAADTPRSFRRWGVILPSFSFLYPKSSSRDMFFSLSQRAEDSDTKQSVDFSVPASLCDIITNYFENFFSQQLFAKNAGRARIQLDPRPGWQEGLTVNAEQKLFGSWYLCAPYSPVADGWESPEEKERCCRLNTPLRQPR